MQKRVLSLFLTIITVAAFVPLFATSADAADSTSMPRWESQMILDTIASSYSQELSDAIEDLLYYSDYSTFVSDMTTFRSYSSVGNKKSWPISNADSFASSVYDRGREVNWHHKCAGCMAYACFFSYSIYGVKIQGTSSKTVYLDASNSQSWQNLKNLIADDVQPGEHLRSNTTNRMHSVIFLCTAIKNGEEGFYVADYKGGANDNFTKFDSKNDYYTITFYTYKSFTQKYGKSNWFVYNVYEGSKYDNGSSGSPGLGGTPTTPSYFKYVEATDPTYTSKARVDETNAVVVTKAEKSSGVEVYYTGIDLYDSENKLIKRFTYKNTNVSASQTMFHVWWDFNAEVGITLTPGTTYRYRFTAETSIGNFTGDLLSFTTKGTSPTPEKPLTVPVTFDAMGGGLSSNAKEVTPGKPYGELPSAYKDGYTFDGWFTSPDGGETVTENTVVSKTSGHTLYAHWTQTQFAASTVSIDVYVRLYKADGNEYKESFWQTLTPKKSDACYFTPPAYEGYDYFRVGVTDSVESFNYTDGDLCCFTASADGKIYIFYAPVETEKTQWPITVKANPSTCIDLVSASHKNAAEGDKITIKLSSNDKFMPVGISVKDGKGNTVTFEEGKDNSYTFTMPDETVQVTGSFKETVKDKPVYDIKVSSTVGGRILVSLEKSRSGEDITVKVVPYESNKFKSLSITTAQGYAVKYKKVDESIYTFKMPDSSVTVNTVFEAINETPDEPKDEPLNNPFADVAEKDWFYDAVAYTAKNGLMGGKTNGIFDPNGITTRAEMVTILYRMDGNPTVTKDVRFDDVPGGQWYSDAISWAAANEIVGGYGNGKFGMDDTITREQMAAILYRYASYKGYDLTKLANLTGYTDADTVSDWAVTAMRWAVAEGVINGTNTTILSPYGDSTRAQVATIFMRFYENIVK